MDIKIEILKRMDLPKYKMLIDTCFDGSESIEEYEKKYNEESQYTILVAKDGEKVVGSITFYKIDLFTFSFQPALEIFNVAVLPEYRGQKIAKMIFEYVIKYAKENGYKSIYLTCLENACAAHKLYESVGFKRMLSTKFSMMID